MTGNLTEGKRYRVTYEGVARGGGRWVNVGNTTHVVPDDATVEQLPDPEPDPEPAYEHGKWYLDADGNPLQYHAWDPAYPAAGGRWCNYEGDFAFAEPLRFPDGSMHRIADGGRP